MLGVDRVRVKSAPYGVVGVMSEWWVAHRFGQMA